MKKLLFAMVVAGLWCASSKSYTDREVEMRAVRAIDADVNKFRGTKLANFYKIEYGSSIKGIQDLNAKFTRELTRLTPQAVHIDPKNGPKVIELSHALSKAQEAASQAANELYQYITVKSATINQEKTN